MKTDAFAGDRPAANARARLRAVAPEELAHHLVARLAPQGAPNDAQPPGATAANPPLRLVFADETGATTDVAHAGVHVDGTRGSLTIDGDDDATAFAALVGQWLDRRVDRAALKRKRPIRFVFDPTPLATIVARRDGKPRLFRIFRVTVMTKPYEEETLHVFVGRSGELRIGLPPGARRLALRGALDAICRKTEDRTLTLEAEIVGSERQRKLALVFEGIALRFERPRKGLSSEVTAPDTLSVDSHEDGARLLLKASAKLGRPVPAPRHPRGPLAPLRWSFERRDADGDITIYEVGVFDPRRATAPIVVGRARVSVRRALFAIDVDEDAADVLLDGLTVLRDGDPPPRAHDPGFVAAPVLGPLTPVAGSDRIDTEACTWDAIASRPRWEGGTLVADLEALKSRLHRVGRWSDLARDPTIERLDPEGAAGPTIDVSGTRDFVTPDRRAHVRVGWNGRGEPLFVVHLQGERRAERPHVLAHAWRGDAFATPLLASDAAFVGPHHLLVQGCDTSLALDVIDGTLRPLTDASRERHAHAGYDVATGRVVLAPVTPSPFDPPTERLERGRALLVGRFAGEPTQPIGSRRA